MSTTQTCLSRTKSLLQPLTASIEAKLGKCRRCWRLSLQWATVGWVVSVAVELLAARGASSDFPARPEVRWGDWFGCPAGR